MLYFNSTNGCLYIFFDTFSAYLKNSFKPEPGNRAESLYTREN